MTAWVLTCVLAWAGVEATVPDVTIAPGVKMPMMAMGAWPESFKSCTVLEGVEQWLALGGRHIDTADDYGSQSAVGKAIKNSNISRDEVFITTKIPGPIGRQAAIEKIKGTALPQLGVEYIDLVLIHFPCENSNTSDFCGDEHEQERLETWQGLVDLQEAGLIRAGGVSNWNAEHVKHAITPGHVQPAVNQVEWHLGYHNDTFLTDMASLGVTMMAWAPLAGPSAQADYTGGHPGISLSDPALEAIAARYNRSTAQVALRWSTQRGVVPVTASCTASHVLGDLESFEFDLSDDDLLALDALKASQLFVV